MLEFFIIGFLFAVVVNPILENFTRYICTIFEYLGTKLAVKTQHFAESMEEKPPVVGFIQPEDNYEEDDDNEN